VSSNPEKGIMTADINSAGPLPATHLQVGATPSTQAIAPPDSDTTEKPAFKNVPERPSAGSFVFNFLNLWSGKAISQVGMKECLIDCKELWRHVSI